VGQGRRGSKGKKKKVGPGTKLIRPGAQLANRGNLEKVCPKVRGRGRLNRQLQWVLDINIAIRNKDNKGAVQRPARGRAGGESRPKKRSRRNTGQKKRRAKGRRNGWLNTIEVGPTGVSQKKDGERRKSLEIVETKRPQEQRKEIKKSMGKKK